MVAAGDPEAINLLVRLQSRVRYMLIRKGIIKDPKHRDKVRGRYFQDVDYFETMQPKHVIDLSVLFDEQPLLVKKVYEY